MTSEVRAQVKTLELFGQHSSREIEAISSCISLAGVHLEAGDEPAFKALHFAMCLDSVLSTPSDADAATGRLRTGMTDVGHASTRASSRATRDELRCPKQFVFTFHIKVYPIFGFGSYRQLETIRIVGLADEQNSAEYSVVWRDLHTFANITKIRHIDSRHTSTGSKEYGCHGRHQVRQMSSKLRQLFNVYSSWLICHQLTDYTV
jgi:hypothetical protein